MKKIKIILALLCFGFSFSQVGVNTPDPKATFDIAAKSTIGTSTIPEGLLIPRVDRQKAQSMTGLATSTLIYVNNVSTGSQADNAVNIDALGYYYFDGSVWVKFKSGSFGGKNTNIYNSNGTLTENRIIAQGNRTLAFTGTSAQAFSVDATTFSADAANHRVGIGTAVPTLKLVVQGVNAQPSLTNAILRVDGSSNHALDFGTLPYSPYGAYVSSLDKTGIPLPLILNPLGSNVGIGTINPSSAAILDLSSTNKGFLPPRMNTNERNAISSPPEGLMIFNTTTKCMENWDNSKWVSKCSTLPPIDMSESCSNTMFTNSGTFTVGGTNVTATFSNALNYTQRVAMSRFQCNGNDSEVSAGNFMGNYIDTGKPDPQVPGKHIFRYPSSSRIRIKFNRPVTNFKVFHSNIHDDEKYTYTFKKNGITVYPTMQLICNKNNYYSISSTTITSNKVIGGAYVDNPYGTYVIGGAWFDEVEINGTQTGGETYPNRDLPRGSGVKFCIGNVL